MTDADNDPPSGATPFREEFNRRKAELLAMPGFRLKVDLEALGRAGHTFYENANDLARHAGLFLHGRQHVYTMTDAYERELVRFLHNYLTSVYSLIEAQRVVMRHCWGESSEFETGEYTTKRKAVFESGEAEFATELRNYCTHRSIPLPGMVTTLTGERGRPPRLVNELKLDRDELLKWKKWTAPAKAYLRAKDPQFDLPPVIESYMEAASRFFNWFTEEINKRNAADRDKYLAAAHALKKWYEDETGLTEEFPYGPPPTSPEQRAQRRAAERRQRKAKGKKARRR